MPMQRVTGEPAHRKRGGISSADDDCVRQAQVCDYRTVLLRHQILLQADAVGVCKSLLIDIDFDRYRYPGQ